MKVTLSVALRPFTKSTLTVTVYVPGPGTFIVNELPVPDCPVLAIQSTRSIATSPPTLTPNPRALPEPVGPTIDADGPVGVAVGLGDGGGVGVLVAAGVSVGPGVAVGGTGVGLPACGVFVGRGVLVAVSVGPGVPVGVGEVAVVAVTAVPGVVLAPGVVTVAPGVFPEPGSNGVGEAESPPRFVMMIAAAASATSATMTEPMTIISAVRRLLSPAAAGR